ncbi:hypothetical protein Dimus_036386 [Dionaea muscipula]
MVGRRRGFSQKRVREVGYDSRSPDPFRATLIRGSPCPTARHFRRAPPSPGLRTRHQRSPSPGGCSSMVAGMRQVVDVWDGPQRGGDAMAEAELTHSMCDDGAQMGGIVPLPASVRSVEAATLGAPLLPMSCGILGVGDGGLVSEEARALPVAREALRSQPTDGLRQPPLTPAVPVSGAEGGVGKDGIYEDGGRTRVLSSSISGSPVLLPTAAVLVCQDAIDAGGRELVSSFSSSLLGADVSASSKRVDLAEAAAIDGEGLEVAVAYSRCSDVEGLRSSAEVSDDAIGDSFPHFPLVGHRVEGSGFEGDSLDSEFTGGERDSPAAATAMSPVGSALLSPVGSFLSTMSVGAASVTAHVGAHVDGGAEPLPSGSNLHVVVGPLSASSYLPIGGSVGHVGDGLVSEEGWVSPAAREALRSQPVDGLR